MSGASRASGSRRRPDAIAFFGAIDAIDLINAIGVIGAIDAIDRVETMTR